MSTDNLFLRASNLTKRYGVDGQDQHPVTVLTDVSIQIDSGQTVAITGASGSGKSTLLHLLAGLDGPDAGSVIIDGLSMFDLDESVAPRPPACLRARWHESHNDVRAAVSGADDADSESEMK